MHSQSPTTERTWEARFEEQVELAPLRVGCELLYLNESPNGWGKKQGFELRAGDGKRMVLAPEDLRGCVSISSTADVEAILDFFAVGQSIDDDERSLAFEPREVEIFRESKKSDCYLNCMPDRTWERLDLKSRSVERLGDTFIVRRPILRGPSLMDEELFQQTLVFGPDGEVRRRELRRIRTRPDDLLGLGYPIIDFL